MFKNVYNQFYENFFFKNDFSENKAIPVLDFSLFYRLFP